MRRAAGMRYQWRRTQRIFTCSIGPSVDRTTELHSTSAGAPQLGQLVILNGGLLTAVDAVPKRSIALSPGGRR